MARVIVTRDAPPPAPPPRVEKVVLDLNEDEAVFLGALLGSLPSSRHGQNIYDALYNEGLGYGHAQYGEVAEHIVRKVFKGVDL